MSFNDSMNNATGCFVVVLLVFVVLPVLAALAFLAPFVIGIWLND